LSSKFETRAHVLRTKTSAVVTVVFLTVAFAQDTAKNHVPRLTPEQWREDLHVLATEVARRHKNAFHFTPKPQFDRAVSDLDRGIPQLQGSEIMIGMMRILAMVGDGHTRSDDLFNSFGQFPIDLYWFGSELRVIRTTREYKVALGGRVIAIGSTPSALADQKVRNLIEQHETEGWLKRFSAYYLSSPEVLRYFGIISDLGRGTYVIENGARTQSITFESIPYNTEPEYLDAEVRLPAYREDTKNVWFRYMEDSKLIYVAFNSYPPVEDLKSIAASLFALLDAHPGSALVIDFRANGGGDYIRFDEILLDGLKKRKWLYQRGHLFGLIGRKTFSAAMMNALQLRQQMRAILVGEPTGARPNSYSEAAHFVLPNSHFEVTCSRLYYHLVPGNPAGVIPDKLLPPTWSDYQAGNDSPLIWVMSRAVVN